MKGQKDIHLTFVIPDVNAFQSGGNIYNKNLIEGLRKIGYKPIVMDLTTFLQISPSKLTGYYFFDTLYFNELAATFKGKNSTSYFYLIVHHLESLYPPEGWTRADYFQQKEWVVLRQYDGFVTSSPFTSNYLDTNDLNQHKITLLPAIDFKPRPNNKTVPTVKGIMVANLVERKGIFPFLEALAIYLETNLPTISKFEIHIDLIGTAEIEPVYAEQCLSLIINHPVLKKIISYHGQLLPQQLYSFYTTANLFISTSFMETYGMALQEARAFQLPILALDCGNVSNHVENLKNGWLMPAIPELIKQLGMLITQPNLVGSMQQKIINRKKEDFYTWEKAARLFIQQLHF